MPRAAPIHVLNKALALLGAIDADRGASSLSALAERAGVAPATAHRIVVALEQHGAVSRVGRGRYMIGPALLAMADAHAQHRLLATLGGPIVRALARATGLAAHLGVFEGDMVTYLVKAGRGGRAIFTREGMQLEAYCSGIGKALLAHLPDDERRTYLAAGPFIPLTPHTITDPQVLSAALDDVRRQGYACDDCEIDLDLRCLAAPIHNKAGAAIGAISISSRAKTVCIEELKRWLPTLQSAARDLERALYARLSSADCAAPPDRAAPIG